MVIDGVKIKVMELEARLNLTFPKLYFEFLCGINSGDVFEVKDSGICFYSYSDLEERNQTYEVREYEYNYFMIGQDGDLGYFIKIDSVEDDSIFSNDLESNPWCLPSSKNLMSSSLALAVSGLSFTKEVIL